MRSNRVTFQTHNGAKVKGPSQRRAVMAALAALSGCVSLPPPSSALPESRQVVAGHQVEAEPAGVQDLAVPGFLPAVLVVPEGVGSRPLVVAAHGAGGAPEWDCDYWSRLTLGRAFVLCPRGTRINPRAGFYFRDHHALDAELTAAVAAARRGFSRIAVGSGIYAGFSQGASMGSLIVARHANDFPYVILVEGFVQLNVALGRSFVARGGQAVLFACGTRECAKAADVSSQAFGRAGLRARVEHAVGAGHTASGQVEALVAANLPWLLAEDASWAK